MFQVSHHRLAIQEGFEMPEIERPRLWNLLKKTASEWTDRNAPRLGAALAYYSLLSVAPLLVFLVAVCGLAFGQSAAQHKLLGQVQEMAGPSVARALLTILRNAHHASSGIFASIAALVTLLFGASGVFLELRESLNTIWDAPSRSSMPFWKDLVWQRLISFCMVVALGLLLLASLLVSAASAVVLKFFRNYLPPRAAVLGELANFLIPLIAIAVLFALIYKFVPDVPIKWRDVAVGAVVTAVLFQIGKTLLALYLATAGVGSTYGAAGSIVAFIVWVYYSAQIFFFGAIFTHVYASAANARSRKVNSQPGQNPSGTALGHSASA
jgi:membrane protein